jgi:hypothetical protein
MIPKTSLWKNNNKQMSAGSANFKEDNSDDCSSSDDSQNKMNSISKNRSLKTNSHGKTTKCPSKSRFRNVFVVVLLTTFACVGVGVDSSSINDCRGVRFAYSARGLDIKDVPRQPRQGRTDPKSNLT